MEKEDRYNEGWKLLNLLFYFFLIKGIIAIIIASFMNNEILGFVYGFWCFFIAIMMKLLGIELALNFMLNDSERKSKKKTKNGK